MDLRMGFLPFFLSLGVKWGRRTDQSHAGDLDVGGERGLAFDRHVGREAFERLRAEALHLHELRGLLEGTVLGAVGDDAFRRLGTDAREQRELRGIGGVDVDHSRPAGRSRRGVGHGGRGEGEDHESEGQDGEGLPHGLDSFHVHQLLVDRNFGFDCIWLTGSTHEPSFLDRFTYRLSLRHHLLSPTPQCDRAAIRRKVAIH
jgi:hypothetical protein